MNWICSQCGEKFSRFRTRCPHEGARVIEDLTGLLIGGRYRIRELIGVGGMDSTVWKAWQTGTERTVAVKVLPPADEASARRFARGARIAANLNHPNCSVIHDYGKTEDGKLYLVMEFLAGQTLAELLGPTGTTSMPPADVVHVAIQVLQALEHAHAERAVHRDLKPDNLFLTRRNDDTLHVKILDFGIAKYVEEDPTDTSTDAEEKPADGFEDLVTEQRQVCGTPQYMAPEQVVGARIDQRTDLYSLGCVMYRMLTGRLPFDGKTRYELYQKHLQEPPRPFSAVRPDLAFPERLELIVMKALMKRPDQRFQSAAEMRKALETVDAQTDRARKQNRPRVALKDTSPQQPHQVPTAPVPALKVAGPAATGGDPTILPPSFAHVAPGAAPFTLSAPALPPSVVVSAHLADAPAPPPLPVPPRPAPLGAALPPPPLPSTSDLDVGRARGGNTLAEPAVAAPDAARGARPPTDLVLRHPPRSTLSAVAPAVPRSTETQPNRTEAARESRRRKLTIAAVLVGAFGLGVVGVAVVMQIVKPAAPRTEARPSAVAPSVAGEPAPTVADPVAGTPSPEAAAEGQAGATSAARPTPTSPGVIAPAAVASDKDAVVTRAGLVAGEGLAEVPLAPTPVAPAVPATRELRLTSDPEGATVKKDGAIVGTTPLTLHLGPGRHALTLERAGSKPGRLELVSEPAAGAEPMHHEILLEPLAAPRAPTPQTGPTGPTGRVTPIKTEPRPVITTPPPKPEPPATDPKTRPTVKLLDEGEEATPPGKKPTVKLLDDGEPPEAPAKPRVKVLEE